MNRVIHVFLSSTWVDLQPERRAAETAIQRIRETRIIGMDFFGSRNETPTEASLEELDRSDICVLIIGSRYGSGITEKEYQRARNRGLQCLVYLQDAAPQPPQQAEDASVTKLTAFRARLRRAHTVSSFSTPDDLAAKLTADLHRWLFDHVVSQESTWVDLDRLRVAIARHWHVAVLGACALTVFVGVFLLFVKLSGLAGLARSFGPLPLALLFASALTIALLVRSPSVYAWVNRFILGSPSSTVEMSLLFRGPVPYGETDHLPDRKIEADLCWKGVERGSFFALEGESGSGKSSLLQAVLLPRARGHYRVVEARVTEDPVGRLVSAARGVPYASRTGPIGVEEAMKTLLAIPQSGGPGVGDALPSPVMLCLDQFEELFLSVRDSERVRFATLLRDWIRVGGRVLVGIRSDFRDLLDRLCRTVDPDLEQFDLSNDFQLQPFTRDVARAVFGEIMEPVCSGDAIRTQQFEGFGAVLIEELLRPPRDRRICREDEKTVLPVELQVVGSVIQNLGARYFAATRLAQVGGKVELFRRYVDDVKRKVMQRTGVTEADSMRILRQFISARNTRAPGKAAAEVAAAVSMPVRLVDAVLGVLAARYVLNRLPGAQDGEGGRYELMHDHLSVILSEAPDATLQKARDAEERLRFWLDRREAWARLDSQSSQSTLRRGLRKFARQEIPIAEALRLWRFAPQGESRQVLRGSILVFSVKALVALVLAMLLPPRFAGHLELVVTEGNSSVDFGEVTGGDEFRIGCPKWEILHGVEGASAPVKNAAQSVIWELAAICKPLTMYISANDTPSLDLGYPHAISAETAHRGMKIQGGRFRIECPQSEAVTSAEGETIVVDGWNRRAVNYLILSCGRFDVVRQRAWLVGPTEGLVTVAPTQPTEGAGQAQGGTRFSFACPASQVFGGINGHSGNFLDAVGFRCVAPKIETRY